MEKLPHQIGDINKEYLKKIKEILPEVFTEVAGKEKVDIDKLLTILGEDMTDDFEKYEFKWKGKRESLAIAGKPSTATLRLCMEESKNADVTQNLYIEGDNLEVLKLLQRGYHSQVKMIYIDPPYNTGNDFIYEDDFSDNIANYKEVTMQMFRNNPETAGRFHTKWLNMMYPRLRLAKTLLRDDGVIFISIDDNEVANLRKICDEVFGEDNFIGKIIHKNNSMKNQSKFIGVTTEYVLVYTKSMEQLKDLQGQWRTNKKGTEDIMAMFKRLTAKDIDFENIRYEILEMYKRPKYSHLSRWNKVDENGVFTDKDLSRDNGYKKFTIINPNTGKKCIEPSRGWAKQYDELIELQNKDMIWYGDESTPPREKSYITEQNESVFDNFVFADSSIDKKELFKIFNSNIFDFPKPLDMIMQFIKLCTNGDDIILDFFSGSATTAHAVMQLNVEDNGNRRFICVQLPELCDEKSEAYKTGYKNICEIGKERIRRAGDKIKAQYINDFTEKQRQLTLENAEEIKDTETSENTETKPITTTDPNQFDNGFRVLKLDNSNLNRWDTTNMDDEDIAILEARLLSTTDTIKKDRTDLDLCFEVMLKLGIDLNESVTEIEINDKKAYSIGEECLILICLDKNITEQHVREILDYAPGYAVFAEHCFENSTEKLNVKLVIEKARIKVRSL